MTIHSREPFITGVRRKGLLTIFLLLAALSGGQSAKPDVVGHWVSVNRTKGGIGSMWDFKADGTVTMTPGALVDQSYEVRGNKIVLQTGTGNSDVKTVTFTFRIEGDTLYQGIPPEWKPREAKAELRLARISKPDPADSPIVGTWRPLDKCPQAEQTEAACNAFQNATYTYTKDGICKLRIPFRAIPGTYTNVDGKSGTFVVSSRPNQVFRYRIEAGKLYLSQPPKGDNEDVHTREDYEPQATAADARPH
jgi:hypothetical protein